MDYTKNFERIGLLKVWEYQTDYRQRQLIALGATITLMALALGVEAHPLLGYALSVLAFLVCWYGNRLTPRVEATRRRSEDYQAVTDEAFVQVAYEDLVTPPAPAATTADVELCDPTQYFERVGSQWRTHLAMLSPTDTGKSSTLKLLLSERTQETRCMVIAIEPKGAKWESLPQANVIRVGFQASADDAQAMIHVLQSVMDEAQRYVDGKSDRDYTIIVILEEWLSFYNSLNLGDTSDKRLAKQLKRLVTTFVGVGRGALCQLILISQSPNVADIGVSGGVRRNLRILVQGSELGGMEAIETSIDNRSLVPKSLEERLLAERDAAEQQLESERHPLIMTNLLGAYQVFPSEFMDGDTIDALAIRSLSIDARFRPERPQFEKVADALESPPTQPDPAVTLADMENEIAAFFTGRNPNKWLYASQVKNYIPLLKDAVDIDVVEKVCIGLAAQGRIRARDIEGRKKAKFAAKA